MKKVAFPIMLFAAIAALPVGKASAQDPLAGALIGGALGGVGEVRWALRRALASHSR